MYIYYERAVISNKTQAKNYKLDTSYLTRISCRLDSFGICNFIFKLYLAFVFFCRCKTVAV
jgi:hypothetical protein